MLGKPSVSISGCLKSDFVSQVTHEGFYYQFLNEINTIGVLGELSKDDLKQAIFLVIYGRDTLVHVQDKKIKYPLQAFKKCYPDVMALYNALKKGDRKDSYKFLPRMLQNVESVLFLDRIIPCFMRENKEIPIYSVHDCAIVPVSCKEELEKIVVEEKEKAIGYKPCYKMEDLVPEKAFASISTTIKRLQYFTNTTGNE